MFRGLLESVFCRKGHNWLTDPRKLQGPFEGHSGWVDLGLVGLAVVVVVVVVSSYNCIKPKGCVEVRQDRLSYCQAQF